MHRNFGTVLNCIDGRVQMSVTDWIKGNYNLDFVDSITEPGMDRVLSCGPIDEISRIKEKLLVSINAHHSNIVAVVGHHDCAANPSDTPEHIEAIKKSMSTVTSWRLPIDVIGLWVDEHWIINRVTVEKQQL